MGRETAANGGLLGIGYCSPRTGFGDFPGEKAESLRLHAEILPFSGDRDQRPVPTRTGWRSAQFRLPNSTPSPSQERRRTVAQSLGKRNRDIST